MTKKSWFGALMGSDREEFHFLTGQDKTLSQIKADIVHAFLSVSIDVKIPRSLRPDW
jgi:BR serine/threonine kinase